MALEDEGDDSLSLEVVEITPDLAAEWLASNTHNRTVRQIVINRYAGAMERGEWVLNGEAIKWSSAGVLIDGQHRLRAIVQSGVTVVSLVVRGLAPETQESLDHHVPRQLRDVLTLREEHSASDLAAGLVMLHRFAEERFNYAISPTVPQALDLLERYPEIRQFIGGGQRVNDAIGLPRGMVIGAHCWLARIDAEDAGAFFESLATGQGLAEGSPILTLREWCLREFRVARSIGGRRPDRQRTVAYLIKAWNAWRTNDEMRQMRWAVGGSRPEAFPTAK